MHRRDATFLSVAIAVAVTSGCAASGTPSTNADNFGWVEKDDQYAPPGEGGFNVRWSRQLTDRWEARFLPVQLSAAAFDRKRDRIYIGTTDGKRFGFALNGQRIFFYEAGAQIESKPAVDAKTGDV
mgnify:CR=1 FL=1